MKTLRFLTTLMVGLMFVTFVIFFATAKAGEAIQVASATKASATTAAASKAEWTPELGKITPSGPYRLWTAINKVLPDYALMKGGKALKARVEGLSTTRFSGKKPADVMAQTMKFKAILEVIRDKYNLPKVREYKDPLGRAMTPGIVFINAGHNLDAVVDAFYIASDKSREMMGTYYDVPYVAGKSPDDVLGLVELATRRLQLLAGS